MASKACLDSFCIPGNSSRGSCRKQRYRLLAALGSRPISTIEAREKLGILNPAARVMELRQSGVQIDMRWSVEVSQSGEKHRVARYHLQSEDFFGLQNVQLEIGLSVS